MVKSLAIRVEDNRILVADDDLMIRKMVVKVLEREGYGVDEAKDGAEAIEMCAATRYRVVLLDMMMPRVDGVKVLRWLEEHRPDLIDRVVVMTAFTRLAAETAERFCRVIYKPFDIDDLVSCVRERAETRAD
ncbi:MAG TPA: response regulator [Thermoanaerobaculia bacterium]|nr:response regulator [Thermoanaerobaculia bacterium]